MLTSRAKSYVNAAKIDRIEICYFISFPDTFPIEYVCLFPTHCLLTDMYLYVTLTHVEKNSPVSIIVRSLIMVYREGLNSFLNIMGKLKKNKCKSP